MRRNKGRVPFSVIGFLIILFSCISYSQNIIIDKNDKLNRNSNLNLLIYSAEADIETSLYKCVADALTGEYEFSDENDIEEIGNYAKNEFGNFLSYNFPKEDKNYVIGIESYELNTSLKYSYEKNGRSFIQTVKNYFFNFTGKVKLWIKDIIKDIIYYKDLIINKIIDTGEGIIKSLIDKFSKKAIEKYIVGAYYYPWYNGTAKIHWPEGYKNNPILGEYDSGNSTIAEKHISWAYRYGINVFSVSWWGPNCSEEQNLQNGLLSARNINDIKFSIYYESIGRLGDCDFDDLNTKKTFTSDLYYIAKKYFSHPSYYKIDNRPVLGIYSANLFKGDYKNAILEARANLSENGYELYLIGDFHTTIPPFILTNKIRCFDAVSPYNPYNSIIAKLSFQKMSFFTKIIETQYIIWKLWVTSLKVHGYKDRKLDFMPCAIPSYDDTALKNRNNKPIHGDKDDFVQTLKMAKKSSDKVGKEGNRVIWLCSFNEWHEGTTIEPSIEYDFDYLEALNIVFEPNTYKIGNLTGNIQWTEINKNKGNKLNFSFVHITDLHIGIGDSDYGTSGYNDTMPIGDVGSNEKYLRAIVNWTNSNKDIYNLSFVIVTGDITDSAEKSEFLKAKEILDTLEIPYIPLLGNHDVWPMTKDTEAEASIGDFYFNEVFSPVFYNLSNKFQKWDNGTKNKALFNGEAKNLNGSTGHNSYFQNFAFEYNGYYFICLDFVSRDFTNSSFGKGVLPQAKLYDSDKVRGTFSWLKEKLKNNTDKGKDSILLFSHHPASKDAAHHSLSELGINNIFTRVITSALFTFSPIEYAILTYELNKYKEDIGGWFAGHFHKSSSYNIKPTIPISTICPGIVTASTFDGGNAHIRIVDVYGK